MYEVKVFPQPDGSRIRLVIDENHEPMYGLDTEEETQAAIDHENAMLNSHEWIALGRIHEAKCPTCETWHQKDSLWGIVVENNSKGFDEALTM